MGRGRGSFVLTGAVMFGRVSAGSVRRCLVRAVRPRKGSGGEGVCIGNGRDRRNDHEGSDGC